MSIYCVSDIHGQYDLFMEGLKKINFNHSKDELYILGDVCDQGKKSLDIYEYIIKNNKSIHLLLGNHEIHLIKILKVWLHVIKHQDLFDAFKTYVDNYVTNFENNVVVLKNISKNSKYFSTDRRKICFECLKTYRRLCKKYKIEDYEILLKFYEKYFCIKNLMKEFVARKDFDYEGLLQYLLNCKYIYEVNINNKKWIMYHCEYSEKSNKWMGEQLISKLSFSFNSTNVNYIFGHTPVPKVTKQIIPGLLLNYNKILKVVDSNNNKFFNIDVSHYGVCFFRLDDLNEFYCGESKNKEFCSVLNEFKNYAIQDVTDYENIFVNNRYVIYKDGYLYYLVVVPRKEIYTTNKEIHFFEIAKMFCDKPICIRNIDDVDITNLLKIFIQKIENVK